MMILSIFNKFLKKYCFADKNVHTASNGIIIVQFIGLYRALSWDQSCRLLNSAKTLQVSIPSYSVRAKTMGFHPLQLRQDQNYWFSSPPT